ncbi:FAD-dependent oxidoreductase, partial [Thiohalocapsa sp. ML1]|uniref:FAD-dependent oxidoreductase n=1 Tax=Thiohalocapsa sp. ML1 TaxID=1431688 RepID=UPI000B090E9A
MDDIFEQAELPASVAVIGLGPIGLEIGQALHRLGVVVTGIDHGERVCRIQDPMPPARDLRRGSRAVAHAALPGGRLRLWPLIGPDAADAASSRVGAEPAGKPAIPVRRGLGAPAFSRLR